MRWLIALGLAAAFITPARANEAPTWSIEVEAGPVWQTTNDVQIPNSAEGDRFSLVDLGGKGPKAAFRAYITWRPQAKHSARLLLAPLSLKLTATPETDLNFNGDTFSGGVPLEATYQFNSWRASYRYRWHEGQRWQWHVGFTAKLRDAKIELDQNNLLSAKTDLGFVPLLHLEGRVELRQNWYGKLDIDALAGGPGRAIDAALKVGFQNEQKIFWEAGYRTVEGGADVDAVYNFAWLHYGVLSGGIRF